MVIDNNNIVIPSTWKPGGGLSAGGDVDGTTIYDNSTANYITFGSGTTLIDNALVYYNFNTDFTSSAPGGFNGTANGATIDTTEKKLGAGSAEFNSDADYVEISNPIDIGTNDFSVAFWVYFHTLPASGTRAIFTTNTTVASNYRLAIYLENNNGWKIRINCKTNVATTVDTDAVTTGQWYHIAFTRQNNTGKVYVNGSFLRNGGARTGDLGNTSNWRIGATTDYNSPDINVDELVYYTREISADDVTALYGPAGAGFDPFLVTGNQSVSQRIVPVYDRINVVKANVDAVNSPTLPVVCAIQKDDGSGNPDKSDLASVEVLPGSLPAQLTFDFGDGIGIVRGDPYHLVLSQEELSTTDYYTVATGSSLEAGEDYTKFDGLSFVDVPGSSLSVQVDETTTTTGPAEWTFLDCTTYNRIIDDEGILASNTYNEITKRNTVTINRADLTNRTYPSEGACVLYFNTGMTAEDLYTSKFRIRIFNNDSLKSTYAFLTLGLASKTDGTYFGTMGLDYQQTSQRNKRIQHNGTTESASVGNQQTTGRGCLVHITNNNGNTYGNVVLDTFATSIDSSGVADRSQQYNVSPSAITAENGGDGIYLCVLFGYGSKSNAGLTQITYDFSIEKSPFIKL